MQFAFDIERLYNWLDTGFQNKNSKKKNKNAKISFWKKKKEKSFLIFIFFLLFSQWYGSILILLFGILIL
jgi:hypothetical protein